MTPDVIVKTPVEVDRAPVVEMLAAAPGDRRRPGRPATVSPALIELLRSRPKSGAAVLSGMDAEVAPPRAVGLVMALAGLLAVIASFWLMDAVVQLNRNANVHRAPLQQTATVTPTEFVSPAFPGKSAEL